MTGPYKFTKATYIIVSAVIAVLVIGFPPNNLFCYDVFGYYMYLPLKFKYNDLTIQDYDNITAILDKYKASETFYQALKWDNGNWVMRYPMGLAVLYSPFYFLGEMFAAISGAPADGFSRPYQWSVLCGCLFYTLVGLWFLQKLLTRFFSDRAAALTLAIISLGTNYFFHVSIHGQNAMSHNMLFTLYAMVLWFTVRWHEEYKVKYVAFLGICVGLAALSRATEIIAVLIPLLYGMRTIKERVLLLLARRKQVLIFFLIIAGFGLLQVSYYKSVSGKFFINPYGAGNPGEGLELLHPHVLECLFSFRKGLFVYTPLMLFAVVGFGWLYRSKREFFAPVLIFSLLNFYIVCSWSCWWYGECFGVRSLIPSYVALSLPMACFFEEMWTKKWKWLCLPFVVFFIFLNLFQSWQAVEGIMNLANTSRDYYFSTFLQTSGVTESQKKLLLRGKFYSANEVFSLQDSADHKLSYAVWRDFEGEEAGTDSVQARSGGRSYVVGQGHDTVVSIIKRIDSLTGKKYAWIRASVWVFVKDTHDLRAYLKVNMIHKKWEFKHNEYDIRKKRLKPNSWTRLSLYFLTPEDLRSRKDRVGIYFSNSGRPLHVDDLLMEVLEPVADRSVF